MPFTEGLFNAGKVLLPENAGQAYDRATKLGSWVTSGVKLYRTALSEWAEFKKYLKRWDNLAEDPTVLFWTINRLLRDDPVKIPMGIRKNIMQLHVDHPIRMPDNVMNNQTGPTESDRAWKPTDNVDGIDKAPIEVNARRNIGEIADKAVGTDYKTPIGNYPFDCYKTEALINSTNVNDLTNALNDLGFGIGYKYVKGFEMGNTASWNVQLFPYRNFSASEPFYNRPNILDLGIPYYRYTLVPDLPSYKLPNISSESPSYFEFSFSRYCPVLSWELQYGNINTMDLELFNGFRVPVFDGFTYNMILSLTILDDVYLSMERYMRYMVNSLYRLQEASMAPYWATLFLIPITIFRPEYKVNFQFMLIGSPMTWSPNISGEADAAGTEHKISIEFSVVGMVPYSNGNVDSNPTNDYKMGGKSVIEWNKINLDPNNNINPS